MSPFGIRTPCTSIADQSFAGKPSAVIITWQEIWMDADTLIKGNLFPPRKLDAFDKGAKPSYAYSAFNIPQETCL